MSVWQRIWILLAVGNVWSCGVACANMEWARALIAVFFAVVCWACATGWWQS